MAVAKQKAKRKPFIDARGANTKAEKKRQSLGVFAMSRGFISTDGRVLTNARPW